MIYFLPRSVDSNEKVLSMLVGPVITMVLSLSMAGVIINDFSVAISFNDRGLKFSKGRKYALLCEVDQSLKLAYLSH